MWFCSVAVSYKYLEEEDKKQNDWCINSFSVWSLAVEIECLYWRRSMLLLIAGRCRDRGEAEGRWFNVPWRHRQMRWSQQREPSEFLRETRQLGRSLQQLTRGSQERHIIHEGLQCRPLPPWTLRQHWTWMGVSQGNGGRPLVLTSFPLQSQSHLRTLCWRPHALVDQVPRHQRLTAVTRLLLLLVVFAVGCSASAGVIMTSDRRQTRVFNSLLLRSSL